MIGSESRTSQLCQRSFGVATKRWRARPVRNSSIDVSTALVSYSGRRSTRYCRELLCWHSCRLIQTKRLMPSCQDPAKKLNCKHKCGAKPVLQRFGAWKPRERYYCCTRRTYSRCRLAGLNERSDLWRFSRSGGVVRMAQ